VDYLREPAAIYRQSFATIAAEVDFSAFPLEAGPLVSRLVHACGMVDLVDDLLLTEGLVAAASEAFARGAPVLADCRMVAVGVIASRLPAGNEVLCTLGDERVPARAAAAGTTRSAAAVELWQDRLAGAVVAIGNAPTALFRLLEGLDEGWPKPAAILGFPVGFVGAAEAKAALAADSRGVPFVTLRGRRGGSALAAAAVNALAGGAT